MDNRQFQLSRRRALQAGAAVIVTAVLSGCSDVLKSFTGGPARPTLASGSAPVAPTAAVAPESSPTPQGTHNAVGAPPPGSSVSGTVAVTSNQDFYTVAIGEISPVAPSDWKLTVGGNVDRPMTFTLDDLKKLPVVTEMRTLECISNPAGGPLISNGVWKGFRFSDLLSQVQVKPDSQEVRFDSYDRFFTSIPVALAQDSHSLLVYELNGEPLPAAHGAPLRCLWPGRYGMKQPKWLQKITLIRDPIKGYWEEQGWSNEAKIKVNSRLDSPADGATLAPGTLTVQGVAFSGASGVAKVEVSLDDGKTWQPAVLTQAPGDIRPYVWTQWTWTGPAPASATNVLARATDGAGNQQAAAGLSLLGGTFPDGTSDMPRIHVNVKS